MPKSETIPWVSNRYEDFTIPAPSRGVSMKPLRSNAARFVSRDSPQDAQRALTGHEDPYRATAKPPEPTTCPSCGAVFKSGRWKWEQAPEDAYQQKCPACQRIQDQFPAGYVMIKGEFLADHRDEIIALITSKEDREKADHPLQRIMAIEDVREGL